MKVRCGNERIIQLSVCPQNSVFYMRMIRVPITGGNTGLESRRESCKLSPDCATTSKGKLSSESLLLMYYTYVPQYRYVLVNLKASEQ